MEDLARESLLTLRVSDKMRSHCDYNRGFLNGMILREENAKFNEGRSVGVKTEDCGFLDALSGENG